MIRIAVVGANYMGHRTYTDSVCSALSELPAVALTRVDVSRSLVNRIIGYRVPLGRGFDLPAVRRHLAFAVELRRLAARLLAECDLVHVMGAAFGYPFAVARCRAGHRAVLSVGLDCTSRLMRSAYGSNVIQEQLRERFERRTYRAAVHAVAYSDWARDSLCEYGVLAPEQIDVVPPSTPILPLPERRPAGGQLVRIAFVGAPWRRKGGDRLLDWHQQRWSNDAELHILCRDAPDHAERLANVWVHTPMARNDVVSRFLPSCDLFVLPTRHDQGPWVVAEAAGAGLPTVASAIGSIAEMIVAGRTGYLIQRNDDRGFCDAIEALLGDESLRRRMSHAAREFAEQRLNADANFGALARRLVDLATSHGQSARPAERDSRRRIAHDGIEAMAPVDGQAEIQVPTQGNP